MSHYHNFIENYTHALKRYSNLFVKKIYQYMSITIGALPSFDCLLLYHVFIHQTICSLIYMHVVLMIFDVVCYTDHWSSNITFFNQKPVYAQTSYMPLLFRSVHVNAKRPNSTVAVPLPIYYTTV